MATLKFNTNGTLTITTTGGTKHTFTTVSRAVILCRENDIYANF